MKSYFVVDYSSLISTSVHILCFKQLGESLQLISSFFGQVLVNKVTSCPTIDQGEGVNNLCSFICKDGDGNANRFFIWA